MDLSISDTESDDYVTDITDDEWVASGRKIHLRKRKSKNSVSMENQISVQKMGKIIQQKEMDVRPGKLHQIYAALVVNLHLARQTSANA